MVRLCDYATVLFSYLHIGFLTFLALLKTHSEMEHPVLSDSCHWVWLTVATYSKSNIIVLENNAIFKIGCQTDPKIRITR